MASKTSLMEWLTQTKKLAKEEDYMGLAIVDTLIDYVWLVNKTPLLKFRKEISRLCDQYHKTNPFDLFGKPKEIEAEFKRQKNGRELSRWQATNCRGGKDQRRECGIYSFLRETVTQQIELQLDRYMKAREVILWQWFEVIDFMFERPELVDPDSIDDYLEGAIAAVCKARRKKNPLANGVRSRFGRYWRGADGGWKRERRKRF